jgi:hypothetical protein
MAIKYFELSISVVSKVKTVVAYGQEKTTKMFRLGLTQWFISTDFLFSY